VLWASPYHEDIDKSLGVHKIAAKIVRKEEVTYEKRLTYLGSKYLECIIKCAASTCSDIYFLTS